MPCSSADHSSERSEVSAQSVQLAEVPPAPQGHPVRVVHVDDHLLMRELLACQLTRSEPGRYEIVAACGSGHEAIELCLQTRPDLLLLDLMLPGLNGLEVYRRLRSALPQMRVLFFSAAKATTLLTEALSLGAEGFVAKPCSWKAVYEAIGCVAGGDRYVDPTLEQLSVAQIARHALTVREEEVAKLIAEGLSTKEIAARLDRSVKTIEKHRSGMMEKLDLHDAVGVTKYAITTGLIRLG